MITVFVLRVAKIFVLHMKRKMSLLLKTCDLSYYFTDYFERVWLSNWISIILSMMPLDGIELSTLVTVFYCC